jgi:hypothetical protein
VDDCLDDDGVETVSLLLDLDIPITKAGSATLSARRHQMRTAHHASLQRRDRRLPSFKHAVSNLQLWCILNLCMSSVGLH